MDLYLLNREEGVLVRESVLNDEVEHTVENSIHIAHTVRNLSTTIIY